MVITRRPVSGYEKYLKERHRAPANRAEVQLAKASNETSICLDNYPDYPLVDATATAVAASRSTNVQDRQAGIILALYSAIQRATQCGEPDASIRTAIEGISILSEVFEGDESHSLVPKIKKASGRQKSEEYRLRAFVLSLIIMRAKMGGFDYARAAKVVVEELHGAMKPRANIWDVFRARGARDADRIDLLANRFVRQIRAEFRPKPDHEAMPAESVGSRLFAATVANLELGTPTQSEYAANFEITVLLACQLSAAQSVSNTDFIE